MRTRPLILGHRGAPFEAPENTIAGFDAAMSAGADGVELDVQLSGDGVPVVIHDDSLERTTDGRGRVADLPWSRVGRALSAGEPIPSLAQAARWAVETGAWLNVEIKAENAAAATLAVLAAAGLGPRVVVSSFHPAVVAEVGERAPDIRRFLLLERWGAAERGSARDCGAQGVCLHVDAATDAALADLAGADLPVIVWTVDDPDRLEQLDGAGPMAIITNRPAVAVHLRG